jgi:hypothetical protein
MVRVREQQLAGITILDSDGYGTVTASDATLRDVDGIVYTQRSSTPGNNSIWIDNNSPSQARFTNSAGSTIVLGSGGGSGGGSLFETLALGNSSDGYNIDLNDGSRLISSDGYVVVGDDLRVTGNSYFNGRILPRNILLDGYSSSPETISGYGTVYLNDDRTLRFVDQIGSDRVILTEPATQPTVLYVNGTGNDNNSGTISSPLQSVDEALRRLGDTINENCAIRILGPSNLSNGYSCVELSKQRVLNKTLLIKGESTQTTFGTFTVTGYTPSLIRTALSMAEDDYVGQYVEIASSSNADIVGLKRPILRTTTDGYFYLGADFSTNFSPEAVPVGTTFNIVKQNVVFDLDTIDNDFLGSTILSLYGPNSTANPSIDNSSLIFYNVAFNSTTDNATLGFSGNVNLINVHFNSNTKQVKFSEFYGGFADLSWASESYDEFAGNIFSVGLITSNVFSTTASPGLGNRIIFDRSKDFGSFYSVSGGLFIENSFLSIPCVRVKGWDYPNTSGSIYLTGSSTVYLGINSAPDIYGGYVLFSNVGTTIQMTIEDNSTLWVLGPNVVFYQGTGSSLVRNSSNLIFSNYAPTMPGSISTLAGSKLRLVGVNGSSVSGGFSCGYGVPATATTFAVNDYISSLMDGSSIFRSG